MSTTTETLDAEARVLRRLVKTDHVRVIDRVIDYFGECRLPREPGVRVGRVNQFGEAQLLPIQGPVHRAESMKLIVSRVVCSFNPEDALAVVSRHGDGFFDACPLVTRGR